MERFSTQGYYDYVESLNFAVEVYYIRKNRGIMQSC